MRLMASSRAWYMAWVSTVSSWLWLQRPTWRPTWYTELPTTNPSGLKPASRARMNSLTERSLVNRAGWSPLPRMVLSRS
jgi:hypothetical protein